MTWIYSVYRNCKICYVNCNNELILSHLNESNYTVIHNDANFVDSIVDVILVNDYIIVSTKTNAVYYYSIAHNKLNFLGNYFVAGMIFYSRYPENHWGVDNPVLTYYLLIASDTKIMLYVNFVLFKEFTVPCVIENLFVIGSSDKFDKCYVGTSSEKTYILDGALQIIVILGKSYKSIVKFANNYYCLLYDGSINVYYSDWSFLQTITFNKIISICDHHILAFIDSDNNYYHVFFGDTINNQYSDTRMVYRDNNFHIFMLGDKKYLATLDDTNSLTRQIIFVDVIVVTDKYSGKITCCKYDSSNIKRFDAVALDIFISIDNEGILRHNIINKSTGNVTSKACKFEIKLKRMVDTKNARFLR